MFFFLAEEVADFGVGGGVLFVPIVSGFFPFHLDYVRGAGLMVALAGSLAASPGLLRGGMVNLRLAAPFALAASCSAIVGSLLGLALPARVVQTALGLTILGIVALMARARNSAYPEVKESDPLARRLEMCGVYHEPGAGRDVHWRIHRTPVGILLFFIIGLMAGMFGLGAGWANVPVLNLVLGAPLKVAVATSLFILSVVDTAAAWVYLHNGAVLPLIAVPSMFGMMLGARIGARLLKKAHPAAVRRIVLVVLLLAGARALLRGLGI